MKSATNRFEVLRRRAAGMTREELEAEVKGLFLDERFAGVLALIASERDEYVRTGCDQALAGAPGKQSHALGSYFALEGLLNAMKGIVEKRGKGAAPEAGD